MMTTMRRVMIGLIVVSSMANASVGLAAPSDGRARGPKLNFADAKRKHGHDAIRAIGDRLPEVAQYHGMRPERLKALIEQDYDLWVTDDSDLLYICEGLACPDHPLAEPAPSTNGPHSSFDAPYPLTQTFLLHSRPGATKTIFLDFDGYAISNSVWENGGDLQLAGNYSDINTTANKTQRAPRHAGSPGRGQLCDVRRRTRP